ncbi:MAG: hypothetical protein JSV56_07320 [Methanomassiliicoccales archaeon]|nr:MAG: hypothetical protein JSV56_07320 [Methanomassiliicoccales archaeon]
MQAGKDGFGKIHDKYGRLYLYKNEKIFAEAQVLFKCKEISYTDGKLYLTNRRIVIIGLPAELVDGAGGVIFVVIALFLLKGSRKRKARYSYVSIPFEDITNVGGEPKSTLFIEGKDFKVKISGNVLHIHQHLGYLLPH